MIWLGTTLGIAQCYLTAAAPASDEARGRIHLRRQQGLAHRLRPELGEYAPQRADARRERVTVVLDDVVKLLGRERRLLRLAIQASWPRYGVERARREG
jgi:hypothetical protein